MAKKLYYRVKAGERREVVYREETPVEAGYTFELLGTQALPAFLAGKAKYFYLLETGQEIPANFTESPEAPILDEKPFHPMKPYTGASEFNLAGRLEFYLQSTNGTITANSTGVVTGDYATIASYFRVKLDGVLLTASPDLSFSVVTVTPVNGIVAAIDSNGHFTFSAFDSAITDVKVTFRATYKSVTQDLDYVLSKVGIGSRGFKKLIVTGQTAWSDQAAEDAFNAEGYLPLIVGDVCEQTGSAIISATQNAANHAQYPAIFHSTPTFIAAGTGHEAWAATGVSNDYLSFNYSLGSDDFWQTIIIANINNGYGDLIDCRPLNSQGDYFALYYYNGQFYFWHDYGGGDYQNAILPNCTFTPGNATYFRLDILKIDSTIYFCKNGGVIDSVTMANAVFASSELRVLHDAYGSFNSSANVQAYRYDSSHVYPDTTDWITDIATEIAGDADFLSIHATTELLMHFEETGGGGIDVIKEWDGAAWVDKTVTTVGAAFTLTNPTSSLPSSATGANYDLSLASGYAEFKLGGIVQTSGVTFSVVDVPATKNGLTCAINSNGYITFTGASPTWTTTREVFTIKATYQGADYTAQVSVAKLLTGAPGNDGGTAVLAWKVISGTSQPAAPAKPSSTYSSLTSSPATTDSGNWHTQPKASLAANDWQFVISGINNGGTVTWDGNFGYLWILKVGKLEAYAVDTGSLNVTGDLTMASSQGRILGGLSGFPNWTTDTTTGYALGMPSGVPTMAFAYYDGSKQNGIELSSSGFKVHGDVVGLTNLKQNSASVADFSTASDFTPTGIDGANNAVTLYATQFSFSVSAIPEQSKRVVTLSFTIDHTDTSSGAIDIACKVSGVQAGATRRIVPAIREIIGHSIQSVALPFLVDISPNASPTVSFDISLVNGIDNKWSNASGLVIKDIVLQSISNVR